MVADSRHPVEALAVTPREKGSRSTSRLGRLLLPLSMCLGLVLGYPAPSLRTTGAATTSSSGSSYVPLSSPHRILDTRVTGTPLAPNSSRDLSVAGMHSVPADATAVVLNVTVTGSDGWSYLTVYPAGESPPNVSTLDFTTGETVANLTVVQVGSRGQIAIYNAVGTVQVILDLEGYFEVASRSGTTGSYVPLTPARIADTRAGSREPNSGDPLTPGGSLAVQVEGEGGVPATGLSAVALNVTLTDTTQSSYLTAYPTGNAVPLSSNLNWQTGDTLANSVIVPVGTDGQVSFYNFRGDADLVVDVVGYFSDGSGTPSGASLYHPMNPLAGLDAGTLEPNSALGEQVAGADGISLAADAVVANLTSINATEPNLFSVVPEQPIPATSGLSFAAGQTVGSLVVATLDAAGGAGIYDASGTAHAQVDVFGYFQPDVSVTASPVLPCTAPSLVVEPNPSPPEVPGGIPPRSPVTITQGSSVTVDAAVSCPYGSQPSYEYWYEPWYGSAPTLAQSWTGADRYTYDTATWTAGTYDLTVWASSGAFSQGDAALAYVISEPTFQWAQNVMPSESAMIGYMVDPANLGIVAGCYAEWAVGQSCDEDGTPGQCTFWAEINWDSPYFSVIKGNAKQLPGDYTKLTGLGVATTPSVGALAVWSGPGPFAGSSDGHVGVVTAVAADGSSYTVSQMNWSDGGWDISTMIMPFDASSFASQDLLGFLPAARL